VNANFVPGLSFWKRLVAFLTRSSHQPPRPAEYTEGLDAQGNLWRFRDGVPVAMSPVDSRNVWLSMHRS
jgi:hypothetical protein